MSPFYKWSVLYIILLIILDYQHALLLPYIIRIGPIDLMVFSCIICFVSSTVPQSSGCKTKYS